MEINIGIPSAQRKEIAEGLGKLLADSYTLYLKTHNFHWNVTGPYFNSLHALFETQYTDLANAVDEIAERIRALGERAPGSYKEFGALTSITESTASPKAEQMIKEILEGQEIVIATIRKLMPKIEEDHDPATIDLLTRRVEIHEKNAWMLRSQLES